MKTMLKFWMLFLATIAVASAQTKTGQTQTQPAFCQEHGGCWDILIKSGPLADTMHAGVDSTLYPEMRNSAGRKIQTSDIHHMWGTWHICKDAQVDEARVYEFMEFEHNWLKNWRAKKAQAIEVAKATSQKGNSGQIAPVVKPTANPASISAPATPQTAATTAADPLASCQHKDLRGLQEVCLDKQAALDKQAEPANSKNNLWSKPWVIFLLGTLAGVGLTVMTVKIHRVVTAPQPNKRRYYSLWAWATAKRRRMKEKAEARYVSKYSANPQPQTGSAPEAQANQLPLGATEEPNLSQQTSYIEEPCDEILVDQAKPHDFNKPHDEAWDFEKFKKFLGIRLDKAVATKGEWDISTTDKWTNNPEGGNNCLPVIVVSCLESDSTNVWETLNRYRTSNIPALALAKCGQTDEPDGVKIQHFRLGCIHNVTTQHPKFDKPAETNPVVPINQARLA